MAESSWAVASTSSSSTAVNANSNYDVFINHRGPDVKRTFASHLYRRLLSDDIRVFLDKPELQQGDCLTPQIEEAIRSASVHVAIFSPRYAESVWCLKELVLMLQSNAPIIPVFFQVKPSEIRWTRCKDEDEGFVRAVHKRWWAQGKDGPYARALRKLEKKKMYDPQTHKKKLRYDSNTIESWRSALSSVADRVGFELEACNSDEGELVDKVVEGVLKKMKKRALALDVAKYPTGLDDKMKDFENSVLLQQQQRGNPQIFGIVGLGGVGKTTLAKEFFNKKNSEYHRSCFLSDVRDNAGKGYLNSLQRILLKGLTGLDKPINSIDEGIGMLRKHLSSTKAIVIIDDVDCVDQVYALLPHQLVLHSDSFILITSRNKDVLISSGVEESSIYNLSGLTEQHSLELFCLHSFNQLHPPPEFEFLVKKFLEACGALPLSLKVFGALLNGKDTSYWQDQLIKLQRILPDEITQRLRISYDALDREEKQIFLDIACFFIGEDRDMAIRIWDSGLCGFQNLQSKCLVEVNSKNKIKMHDHVRDLGREVAKASGLPRRLWRWTEKDIDDLLEQSSVSAMPVRGIRTGFNDVAAAAALGDIRIRRLQLLDTQNVLVERILTKVQFPNLTWLRWESCPYYSLPSSISMENLKVLRVQGSKLKTLWKNESQAPLQLQELNIEAPLSNIPKSIGKLKHLERIVIGPVSRGISTEVNITKLPEEFCLLQSLKALVLESCTGMKSLPHYFGNLTNPQHVDLFRCHSLEMLPDSFGNLTNLQQIHLSECHALKTLPDTFGNLINLQEIHLSALKMLPDSFGNLTNLHHIQLSGCSALEMLPNSFCKLIKLQYLDLSYCTNLTMSSETLGNISTLEYINLTGCSKIEVFPQQVANQRSLEQLRLGGTNIKELPSAIGELRYLEVLVVGSPLLHTLPPSLCKLKNLKELHIEFCMELKCLPASLGDLKNLKDFKISGCEELTCLPPSLGDLYNLKQCYIWDCKELKCLPASIGQLTQLNKLTVSDCPSLDKLPPSLGNLRNLKELVIMDCKELKCLPAFRQLTVDDCPSIREQPFKREVREEAETYGILPRLQQLHLNGIGISEVSFAEGVCFNLRDLSISECNNLVEVGTLPHTLIQLSFRGCHNLRKIDKIYDLPNLQKLDIYGCKKLEELQRIKTLVSLNASGCVKLKRIRGLGQQTKLKLLFVSGCSELEKVEGVQDCMSLEWFDARGCPKMQWSGGLVEKLRQKVKVRI